MQRHLRHPRALSQLLLVVTAVLALGQLQAVPGGATSTSDLVAGPVTTGTVTVARLARHVPNPVPWSHLQVAGVSGLALLLLLPGLAVRVRSLSPRARPAYLVPTSGRGPPLHS